MAVLSAFLHLGRKYNITRVRVEARKRLYQQFPFTLAEHDAAGTIWNCINGKPKKETLLEFLVIARREGLLSILPSILYKCCKLYTESQIIGEQDLPLLDQIVCLAGHRAICRAQARTTYKWMHESETLSANCATEGRCDRARQKYIIRFFTSDPIIAGLDICSRQPWQSLGLCQACEKSARGRHEAGRLEFWELLPSLLQLPSWSELIEERLDIEVIDMYVVNHILFTDVLSSFILQGIIGQMP